MVSDISDCNSIVDGIDPEKWKNMTKNQKKNYRKKLAHKRKKNAIKMSQSGASSDKGSQEDDEESIVPKGTEIDDLEIDVASNSKKDKDDSNEPPLLVSPPKPK